MATTIQVSDPVKERLAELKEQDEHTSYDSVIRALLRSHDESR